MRGRKTKDESRSAEFRQRLLIWRQTPESVRPSLRALARDLGTSHQLLQHYLDGVGVWAAQQGRMRVEQEYERKSQEIRMRANAEGRSPWGDPEMQKATRTFGSRYAYYALLESLETFKEAAKSGPLNRQQFTVLKVLASKRFPGAQELLRSCTPPPIRKRKRFTSIVKGVPRLKDETYSEWIRRIWNKCDKYETQIPDVIEIEALEELFRPIKKSRPTSDLSLLERYPNIKGLRLCRRSDSPRINLPPSAAGAG